MSRGQEEKLSELIYDGYTVYHGMDDKAKRRTSAESVSDVLDSLHRLSKSAHQQAPAEQEPVGQWSDDEGLSWCDGSPSELQSARETGWLTRTLYTATQPETGMVAVPRELLERIVNTNMADYSVIVYQHKEIRTILEKAND